MQRRTLLQAAGLATLVPLPVLSQDKYPSKPITWICPYAAGGGADARSRQMAKLMGGILGQTIVVENKAGGGGNIGSEAIARAKPDGYTIGMGNFAPLAVNHVLFKKLSYDPFNDLVPIMLIERGPLILTVKPESPFKSVSDIVAAAKKTPSKFSYASGGIGGSHHLSGALFEHAAGIDLNHIPYRSGGAATTDLLGGQVDMMFEQMYAAMPTVKAGKLRALAITSKARSPLAPEVPTMAEAGYPDVESQNWQGVVGPKGLPADIVAALNKAANAALKDPELRALMASQGNDVVGGTADEFARYIKSEAAKWGKVVKDAKIEAE